MLLTCRHVNEQRDLYLDGELSPSLTAEVHAHLLQCPACQQQFEMMRACGDLIAKDAAEPVLDAGFASRVVASLPKRSATSVLVTRRDNRQRFMKIFAGAGLPAAAALLFLSVLIWPTPEKPSGIVLDKTATNLTPVDELVSPAINVLGETRDTIRDVTKAVQKSVDNAELASVPSNDGTTTQPSLLDAFLSPFKNALTPPADDTESDKEVVRF
ncbi:MAG: zf-HC2 domain-containing protein [Phycisphaerales bacterium]|nr:zf-HC2 domain-containing protein [Phycisphaerales bacterium]MCB9864100.1 zf-HC2 domain-containing protein [Phycisphaerales bacterium]